MKTKIPVRLIIGLVLITVFWYLNWSLPEHRTHWGFFPLWLGFALTIDGIVYVRKESSLFSRNKLAYLSLFLISIPVWWFFELFNQLTENWMYAGREHFTDLEYFFLASLSFSTVIPVVFGMAELVSTFLSDKESNFTIEENSKTAYTFLAIGLVMLLLLILFPRVFYVFIWTNVLFIVEGINILMKNDSITTYLNKGNWKPVISLAIGCLICGFFWEMWNYYSYPKWVYDVPGVNFLHVFEMPVLGYLGYIPFSLELYSIYIFVIHLFGKGNLKNYLKF